jgi:acetylornithine deacetylase
LSLEAREARVVAAVDEAALVEAAAGLVRIPSYGGDESPAQEYMAELMTGVGLETDVWELDLDALARHPDHSSEIERASALGVVGTLPGTGGGIGGGSGRSLILNGHVDVVPPGDERLWSRPPFAGVVEDGRLRGRGALDMKGALVAGVFAVGAVRRTLGALAGTVHVESVVGEEDGGLGTLATIVRGYRADGAVVMEPTDLAVAPAQAGALNFRLRVPGLAAHGALRKEGVSALENLFPLYRAMEALEEARNARLAGSDPLFARYRRPFALCVGTVRGGDWASSVPDHVTVEGRLGVAPGEDLDAARAELAAALDDAAGLHPWLKHHRPQLTWWGGRFTPARTPLDHPLVTTLQGAARDVLERPVVLEGMPYGADMGLLVSVGGTPTVLFGPGDIRGAHRPDESVAVDDLVALARSLAVAIVRFCG